MRETCLCSAQRRRDGLDSGDEGASAGGRKRGMQHTRVSGKKTRPNEELLTTVQNISEAMGAHQKQAVELMKKATEDQAQTNRDLIGYLGRIVSCLEKRA
jgi:hypothetical protein